MPHLANFNYDFKPSNKYIFYQRADMELYSYWGKDRLHIRQIRLWYTRSRCQARYLGQEFTVSWSHFLNLWLLDNQYQSHGTGSQDLCFCRLDPEASWTDTNVCILTRGEYLRRRHHGENNPLSTASSARQSNRIRNNPQHRQILAL